MAGLLINVTGYNWVDPVTSFLILAVIVYGTWQLFVDSINLALDVIPKDIDYEEVMLFFREQDPVKQSSGQSPEVLNREKFILYLNENLRFSNSPLQLRGKPAGNSLIKKMNLVV